MLVLYAVLTAITASSAAVAAWMNVVRHPVPVAAAKQVQVPQSWMLPLGALLGAGALGLVAGFAVPALGLLAATGLVLYFVGAIIAHLRVGDFHLGRPAAASARAEVDQRGSRRCARRCGDRSTARPRS